MTSDPQQVVSRWIRGTRRWLNARPIERIDAAVGGFAADEGGLQFFQTGPDLIARIVRAIELGQSVVLSGPRGCGKSYCIRQGIQRAAEEGVIPTIRRVVDGEAITEPASVFVQGNREIPRDYLVEDEITFRLNSSGRKAEVVPGKKAAPLFRFARRSEEGEEGEKPEIGPDGFVRMNFEDGPSRFVLFLDEINRFSDGVLDSLLSVLEEGTAVLAGREYKLPVVVCMTMNPPGYDSSARKLSPPLAARIGRSYRLYSPDIDTLTDHIIRDKLQKMRDRYEAQGGTAFPDVSPALMRRVALVTLCLWGDVTSEKAGNEYLTPRTRDIMARIMEAEPELRASMTSISRLCHFGPDGRAAGDWLATAIGRVIDHAESAGLKRASLTTLALRETVVESVAHKIYDNFSPASRPDLTRAKERALITVARGILESEGSTIRSIVWRRVDSLESLYADFGAALWANEDGFDSDRAAKLRDALLYAGLTADSEVEPWAKAAESARNAGGADGFRKRLEEGQHGTPLLVSAEREDALLAGFSNEENEVFARKVEKTAEWDGPLAQLLRGLRSELGPVRRTLRAELAEYEIIRELGVPEFLALCEPNGLSPAGVRALARATQRVWLAEFSDEDFGALCERDRDQRLAEMVQGLQQTGVLGAANVRDCLQGRVLPHLIKEAMHRRGREAHSFAEFAGALQERIRTG